MVKELKVIQTDIGTLKGIVNEVVNTSISEQLAKQRETDKKSEQIQKILRKDTIAKEVNNKSKSEHIHEDACPSCHGGVNKLDDTVKVCKTCGDTIIKKGAEHLICDSCHGIIPMSYLGTSNPCPHCGGTKAHKA